jgi:hypothetical protein
MWFRSLPELRRLVNIKGVIYEVTVVFVYRIPDFKCSVF